jgi:cellulose synthase/poly-beta-1,6-N-acetylglucosamine synthase-like glycosyltransferase
MIVDWLTLAVFVVLNLAVVPYFLFLLLTSVAATVAPRKPPPFEEPQSRFLIVIPAHNEEAGISSTIRSCLGVNYPSSRFDVVVVADNCADRTAAVAAASGVRVVERFDSLKRSKGFAIEFLIDALEQSGELDSLDALVVIDADTTVDADLLRYFDRGLRSGRDWIQAYYTVANPDESWRTRLMTYAFSLFNGVMPLGQNALGTSAGLKGNGMCLSTRGLRRRPWKSFGLVEDMEYSWALRIAGEKIAFQREASVYGVMLGSGGPAAAHQRRRWEFGRGAVRNEFLGPLLRSRQMGWWEKAMAACELTIPAMGGLVPYYLLLVALDAVVLMTPAVLGLPFLAGFLVSCRILMTASLLTYALSPFAALGLPLRYATSIVFFPLYVGWKLLISLNGPPQQWIRTEREPAREPQRDTVR